ncbi:SGNH/GDSL hydrolase family protein [Actinoallomurus sp. NBC_01490]|uniref:SGNH/GDSL hydrolase family protein n=1 Tax=Actinoallomurus sp. NBC_01490 TaxID=2903557 RepID=UPI002E300DEC|nr:SGNH/GDSL hydrolase family protein [Actinoallomurus sp. NBC_01490]
MKFPRLVASTACAVSLAAAAVTAATSPAFASSTSYVALGDSYSSGTGTGSYDLDSGCQRSSKAYAALWASSHSPASFKFVACSGAKTGDVLNNQVSALSSSTTLASITIGGNDAGFSSTMQTCVLGSDQDCLNAVATAESYAKNTLPGNLNNLFSTMRGRAPSARFVVLDYPHLYITDDTFCIGMSHTKHVALNQAADVLDGVIKTAASNAQFTFADVRSQFSGHELCSGDGWLHAVDFTNIGNSYHPTATGHASGYLPVFTSAAGAALAASHAKDS